MITLAANGLLIIATRTRHTPDLTRRTASAAAVVVTGVYLHLFWLCLVVPLSDAWLPAEWERADLLRPVRLCRGATLWLAGDRAIRIGRIDDLWSNFIDSRTGRGERTISG